GGLLASAFVLAVARALIGLAVRLDATWGDGGRGAAGCFRFCLGGVGAKLLAPRWSRWIGRALWLMALAAGAALAAGVAGAPYAVVGIGALAFCARDAWSRYRRTDHYRARKDIGVMRLLAWIVTFEDP